MHLEIALCERTLTIEHTPVELLELVAEIALLLTSAHIPVELLFDTDVRERTRTILATAALCPEPLATKLSNPDVAHEPVDVLLETAEKLLIRTIDEFPVDVALLAALKLLFLPIDVRAAELPEPT